MGRSRDVKSDNLRIGVRFTENLARELHQAVSAKDRGNFESARAAWENAQQMLDTFITETGIEEYINELSAKLEARAASVAAEGEPPEEDSGSAKKDSKGAGSSKRAGGGAKRSNKGTKRSGGTAGSGDAGGGAA